MQIISILTGTAFPVLTLPVERQNIVPDLRMIHPEWWRPWQHCSPDLKTNLTSLTEQRESGSVGHKTRQFSFYDVLRLFIIKLVGTVKMWGVVKIKRKGKKEKRKLNVHVWLIFSTIKHFKRHIFKKLRHKLDIMMS